MKKKETWREKKVNYKKIKLLSTIISICLIVAVMGIGVLASTQQYSAQVSNSISMRFANLNGTVSVKAYADRVENNGSTGMTDRPELSSTNLFTNDDGALYTSISSGATVANGNLQFTGADFFRVGTDTEVGLTSDTTKAVIGYIFKYEPEENLAEDVVYNKVTITETSGSALNSGLNGSSIETKYYITTDNVDTATAEQYITAIVPNEGASYEVEGTKTFYVLAFCTYENASGMSIKVEGTWSFGLNIEASAESTLTTTSLENNLLNTVSVEQDNPTIARLKNVTSVNKTVTEIKPTDTGYATYRAMVYVAKAGAKPARGYTLTIPECDNLYYSQCASYSVDGGEYIDIDYNEDFPIVLEDVHTIQFRVENFYFSIYYVHGFSSTKLGLNFDYTDSSSYTVIGGYCYSETKTLTQDIDDLVFSTGPWCIEENEIIELADGSTKLAKDICVGDELLGANGEISTVQKNIKTQNRIDCYKISFNNGDSLILTSEHNQLMNDLSVTKVKDLEVGNIVYKDLTITAIEKLEGEYNVCNIEVDNDHTYRIRGNLYTHNGYPH